MDADFERGLEIRNAVPGANRVEASLRDADAFLLQLQKLVTSYCCGVVWGHEALAVIDAESSGSATP